MEQQQILPQSNHHTDTSQKEEKRRSVACIFCRKSHLKCEWTPSSSICNRCLKLNLVCTLAPKNKRGPKNKKHQNTMQFSSTPPDLFNENVDNINITNVIVPSTTTIATANTSTSSSLPTSLVALVPISSLPSVPLFPDVPNLLSLCSNAQDCNRIISTYQTALRECIQKIMQQYFEKQTHLMKEWAKWQTLQQCSQGNKACCNTNNNHCCCSKGFHHLTNFFS